MSRRLLAFSYTSILALLIVSLAFGGEVRKLGSNDLEWGYGTTTSPAGKVVTKIPYPLAGLGTTADNSVIIDVRAYGVIGDNTDVHTQFKNAIDNTPSGGTLYVPCAEPNSYYNVSGGFIRNTPIRIIGAGVCSHIKQTGTTNFAGLFYLGGAVPNGTPVPDFADGTSYTFTGDITAGNRTLSGFSSVSGLAVGDDVYLGMGQDWTDHGQYAYRMFNRIESVGASSVTVEVPIPEDISGTFTATYDFSPSSHVLHKYTDSPDMFEVGNIRVSSSVANSEHMIFPIRARNIYIHDIFFDNTNAGTNVGIVSIAESENATVERVYARNTGGVSSYASRNVTFRDIFLSQLIGSAIYIENQSRGVSAESFFVESGPDHGTQPILFLGGNAKRVSLRNFTFNNMQTGNILHYIPYDNTYNNRYSVDDVITENFYFNGSFDNVATFDVKQHMGILHFDNVTYRDIKRFRKTISLDNSWNQQSFNLLNGILKTVRIGTDDTEGGITLIYVYNTVTSDAYPWVDTGNSWNQMPTAGTFGFLKQDPSHSGTCVGGGTADCKWNVAGMKGIKVSTTTVSPGAKLYLDIEAWVKNDDGVFGAVESTE